MSSATLAAPSREASSAPPRNVRSLGGLVPFLRPYRGRIVAAAVFLVLAAASTLVFPIALKSLIDQGFVSTDPGARVMALREHFFALFGVGVALGVFSAARFYMVSWLGERVTADLHDAGADGGGLQPLDGLAQRGDGRGCDGDADRHQPCGDDAGAGDPGARRAAFALLRPSRAAALTRQPGPHRRLERHCRRGAERGAGRAKLFAGRARGGALHPVDRARVRHRRAPHAHALAAGRLRHQRNLRCFAVGPVPGHAGGGARRHHGRPPRPDRRLRDHPNRQRGRAVGGVRRPAARRRRHRAADGAARAAVAHRCTGVATGVAGARGRRFGAARRRHLPLSVAAAAPDARSLQLRRRTG